MDACSTSASKLSVVNLYSILLPPLLFLTIYHIFTVLRAVQKMEQEELPNLKFLRMDAEDITKVFAAGEVDRIYLNFSDPWPKDRHARRRLPCQ